MPRPALVVILLLLTSVSRIFPDCLSLPSPAEAVKAIKNGKPAELNERCLCDLLTKAGSRQRKTIITDYITKKTVTDTLLFCVYRHPTLSTDKTLRTLLVGNWKQTHPALPPVLARYRQRGDVHRADTLLRILDQDSALGPHQLLQWIEIKEVLDDFTPVPDMLCRVLGRRPHLQPLVLNRFEQILDKIEAAPADSLLRRFASRITTLPQGDAAELRRWIAGQYGRKMLFDRQIAFVRSEFTDAELRCGLLLAIARSCIEQQSYAPAVTAAREAAGHPCDSAVQQQSAVLLFTAFRASNRPDSAEVWLKKSGKEALTRSTEAIDLYLSNNHLQKAADRIRQMQPSLERDTLYLHYLLLSDSLETAKRFVYNDRNRVVRNRYPRLIWRFRIQLFRGATDTCGELLDSLIKVAPAADITRLQEYRYLLLRYTAAPQTLAKFLRIEYTLYKGNRKQAARRFCESIEKPADEWRIGLRIARQQLDKNEYADAIATLQCAPAATEPEYLYYLADARFRNGSYNESRRLLKKLVLDFPAGQFTARARLLLARVPEEQK